MLISLAHRVARFFKFSNGKKRGVVGGGNSETTQGIGAASATEKRLTILERRMDYRDRYEEIVAAKCLLQFDEITKAAGLPPANIDS